jgi:hypothetical protein
MRRALAAAAVLAVIAVGLIAAWLLVWRDDGTDQLAETTTSLTAVTTTTKPATTTSAPTTTTTLPPADSPNQVDLIGVVVAVEAGPGWDTAPVGNCPSPDRGPHPQDCPLIGPATLVLDDGSRLEVPPGTPGGRFLWQMTRRLNPGGITSRRAIIVAGLRPDATVEWVYVLRGILTRGGGNQPPQGEELSNIRLPGGDVASLTSDGWAVTEGGWEYRLADEVRAAHCGHLWGVEWTLAGVAPESAADHWTTPSGLREIWDGPAGTRLAIDRVPYATATTVASVACTDLLDRYHDPDPLGTLASARALWEAGGITDYAFRYSAGGTWGLLGGVWDITVHDGESTAVMVEEPIGDAPPPPGTIEALFEMIEDELTSGPNEWSCSAPEYWTAIYDPATGHPTSFYLDSPECIDEEHGWWIEDFSEL